MRRLKNIVNWLIRGKDGRVHIVQIPNVPLIGWLILMVISQIITKGQARTGLAHLSEALLGIWAYLEITQGASRFRRALGVVVASAVVYGFFK